MTTLDAFLDALVSRLRARPRDAILTPEAMADIVSTARRDTEAPEEWSPWLDWAGGECPLPWNAMIECEFRDGSSSAYPSKAGHFGWTHSLGDVSITRFRYRCERGGWVKRGDWVPPDWLWDEKSPVRFEWRFHNMLESASRTDRPTSWGGFPRVTYIRLLPRAAKPEMPEYWSVRKSGTLCCVGMIPIFDRTTFDLYGPAKIRAAVEAWLDEMERI